MHVVLACSRCDTQSAVVSDKRRGWFNCKGCNSKLLSLGPLPEPNWEMPMGGMVSSLNVEDLPFVEMNNVPKLVCQWCGRNLGLTKDICPRCNCDLEITPAFCLREYVADLSATTISAYCQQAVHPMTADVSLCRLHRLLPERVRRIGGTQELADSMQAEEPPPGAEYNMNDHKLSYKIKEFFNLWFR